MDKRNPWFCFYFNPEDRHWYKWLVAEKDTDLVTSFTADYLPSLARLAVPADNYAADMEYASYKELAKEPKVMFALPGKLYAEFTSGNQALRRTTAYYKQLSKQKKGWLINGE